MFTMRACFSRPSGQGLVSAFGTFLRHCLEATTKVAIVLTVSLLGACAGIATPWQDTVETSPDVQWPQAMRLAEAVRAGGDATGAAVFYRRAHSLAPDRPEPLIGLAEAASAAGSLENAVALYRKAISFAPANPAARLGHGRALLSLGRSDLARTELLAAVDAAPDDYRGYLALGVAYELAGEPLRAQQAFRDGLQRNPDSSTLRNNMALSLALSGQTDEAVAMLRLMALDPAGGTRARRNLALVRALSGDLAEAEAIVAQDLRGAPLQHTIAFFRSLQSFSKPRLAAALMCGCDPGPVVAEAPGVVARPTAGSAASSGLSPASEIVPAAVAEHGVTALVPPRVADVTRGSKTLVVLDRPSQRIRATAPRRTAARQRSRHSLAARSFGLDFGAMQDGISDKSFEVSEHSKRRLAKRHTTGKRKLAPFPLEFGDMLAGVAESTKRGVAKQRAPRRQQAASLRLELGDIVGRTSASLRLEAVREPDRGPPA
jgi:Flp pilus assembly protein TadD